ncbi:MAG: S41 family peptidase [Bacteroidales bacterium]|jgi:carboxyl-terminal processing protease|nr:S41 family peptidase [Bacteroidales bacterium]
MKKYYLPIVFALVLVIGLLLGKKLEEKTNSNTGFYSQNKLSSVLNYIDRNYVDVVKNEKLEEAAIPAMLKQLDPHSVYIPAKELKRVNEPLKGNFDGIGIMFNMQKDTVIVISTITGGPSERIGIMPGDRIVKVNDTIIAGVDISNSEVIGKLKGPRGTTVNVGIKRKNADNLLYFDIVRDKIPLYSVDVSYMINDDIGYVKISRFASTTYKEFVEAIEKLKKQSLKKIIIDLRGNSGGFMNAATNIADQFLDQGKLIVYTEGKSSPRNDVYSTSRGLCKDMDLAILIDEWSASASEILAGAIQDNDRGIIVGRRSFGKGLVQEQSKLSDGSAIRLTIARYYTPTGRCIQKSYQNGAENYFDDLNERFENGEFSEADSIHFNDSLKFLTPEGNVVYGGGGIMPDIFVSIDTSGFSKYLAKISNMGLIYEFAFNYVDNNRKLLSKFDNYIEITKYLEKKNVFEEFIDYAASEGISREIEGYEKSEKLLRTQLKAYIARNIIDNEGFYPIIKDVDKTLQKCISVL